MRGFKIIKGYEHKQINLPKRKTNFSAGYDIGSCDDVLIKAHTLCLIKTGIKAYMQKDEVLKIYARSSLASKRGLMIANHVGIIDSDYFENQDNDGHIMINVYNFTDGDVLIKKNERIVQGIFEKYLTVDAEENIFITREGGFGSTDKEKEEE